MDASKEVEMQIRGIDTLRHVRGGSHDPRLVVYRTNGEAFSIEPTPRAWYDCLRDNASNTPHNSGLIAAASTTLPATDATAEQRETLTTCTTSITTKTRPVTATTIRMLGVQNKEEMAPATTGDAVVATWIAACQATGIRIDLETTVKRTGAERDSVQSHLNQLNSEYDEILQTVSRIEHQVGGSLPDKILVDGETDVPEDLLSLNQVIRQH